MKEREKLEVKVKEEVMVEEEGEEVEVALVQWKADVRN